MKAIHTLALAGMALTLGVTALPAQDTLPPATRPRARMGIHLPGTGLQPGVTPMHQRLGFNQGVWGGGRALVGLGVGQGRCCAPGALLAQRNFLGLTEDQVSQLEGLNTELTEAHEDAFERVRTQRQELDDLWAADQPDANAIRQKTQQLLQSQQDAQLAAVDAAVRSRAILTAEQQGMIRGFAAGQRLGMRRGVWTQGPRAMGPGRVGRGVRGSARMPRQSRWMVRPPIQ